MNYTIKTITLVGTQISILSGSLYFNEPLYVMDSKSCPEFECPEYPECPPCDYTHSNPYGGCGANKPGCPVCVPWEGKFHVGEPCNEDYWTWEDLELNKPMRRVIAGNTLDHNYRMFRYYPGSVCAGYIIKLKYYRGTCEVNVDFRQFSPVNGGGVKQILSEQVDPSITLCPGNSFYLYPDSYYQWYPYETVFIAVLNTGNIDMEFEIVMEEIPVTPPPATPPPACETIPGFTCLQDGVLEQDINFYPVGSFLKFSFTIYECKNITIVTDFLANDIDVFISDSPDLSPENYKWASTYSFDELLVIQGCPDQNQTKKTYYIGILMFYTANYQFWVTTKGYTSLREISTGPLLTGQYSLFSTSYLENNVTGDKLLCDNYDRQCLVYFPLYPRLNINSLWPTPGIYYVEGFESPRFLDTFVTTIEPPASNQYQFGLILSLTIDGVKYTYVEKDDIENYQLKFLDRIFTASGKAISGQVPIKNHVQAECFYEEFLDVEKELNDIIDGLDHVDYTQINGQRYSLDLLTYDDRYYSCKAMAESFLTLETNLELVDTKLCFETTNLTSFYSDPCCSDYAKFDKCCRSREIQIPITRLVNIKEDEVDSHCAFPSCTTSVLEDFAQSITGDQLDPCRVTKEDEDYLKKNMYETFRNCKSSLESNITCSSNSYCQQYYNSTSAYCNKRKLTCDAPYEAIEKFYISCILNNIYPPLKHEVFSKYNISSVAATTDIIDEFYQYYLADDCHTDINVKMIIRTVYNYRMDQTLEINCFPPAVGFDKSAPLQVYDVCYQGVFKVLWYGDGYSSDSCKSFVRCDWMGDYGNYQSYYYIDDMIDICNALTPDLLSQEAWCGDCSDPFLSCFSDLSITDETTCKQNYACYKPIADYDSFSPQLPTVSDPAQCTENYGSCTVNCGYECTGQSCRISNPSGNECPDINQFYGYPGYDPENDSDYCIYYGLTNSQCTSNSGTNLDCSQFSFEQCSICNKDPTLGCDAFGMTCKVSPIPCTNKADCLAAGQCSDSIYFENFISSYPPYQPKCLFPRDYVVNFNSSQPSCKLEAYQDSPFGCFTITNSSLVDETNCLNADGKYWQQSFTQETCESYDPICLGLEESQTGFYLPYTQRFNNKSQSDCECAGQQWVKPFSWTPGVWLPANAVPLQWIPINTTKSSQLTSITNYSPVLQFERLFNDFSVASFKRTTLLYKSEILCRISSVKNSLESLSCSCSSDGSSECFDTLNPPIISVIKPCYAPAQSFQVLPQNNSLSFPLGSIDTGACVSISVGEISLNSFLSKKILALSSNFVSYQVAGDYSIYNDQKAIIGRVLESGVILEFFNNGTDSFEMCLSPQLSLNPSKYPVIDFAMITDEQNGVVHPLQCEVIETVHNTYCCKIFSIDQISKYVLIERIEDWDHEVYQPFSPSSTRMLYTLAVFFLILSIYGVGNLGFFLYLKFFATESLKFVHLLFVFLTFFCLIRCIYFFILPSNIIDQSANVGEYILVVLPTFLYFTSFTIVVVIWYTLTTNSFSSNLFKRMYKLIVAINSVLYILFVVIVLVFNFTKEKSPPTCGGRILAEYANTSPQRVVSILYAVLQSILSLGIGLAFMYYGRKIYLRLSEIKSRSNASDDQKKKVLYIGIICSSGFILHCIFIIILVSANPSNVIFSFIGLIITEIIPVITLFVFNNQFPWNKLRENAIKKISHMNSSRKSTEVSIQLSSHMDTSSSSSSSKIKSSSSSYSEKAITYLDSSERN